MERDTLECLVVAGATIGVYFQFDLFDRSREENPLICDMDKVLLTTACLAMAMAVGAQSPRVITNEEYAHAESMLNYNTEPLIDRAVVQPNWVTGGICWYRVLTATGSEDVLVDAAE